MQEQTQAIKKTFSEQRQTAQYKTREKTSEALRVVTVLRDIPGPVPEQSLRCRRTSHDVSELLPSLASCPVRRIPTDVK